MRGRRFGHSQHPNDARASGNCFQENCNPEPQGSCIQEGQYLDRAPERERRPGAVFLALLQGLLERPWFGAPVFLRHLPTPARQPENPR
jgi:hypothetical protein